MVVFVESKSHEELIENEAYSSIKSRLCTFKESKQSHVVFGTVVKNNKKKQLRKKIFFTSIVCKEQANHVPSGWKPFVICIYYQIIFR